MPCRHVDLGNGARAIICSRTVQKRCYVCNRPAPKLCDYPVTSNKSGTCDRPCCVQHSRAQGKDTDWCLAHVSYHAELVAKEQAHAQGYRN